MCTVHYRDPKEVLAYDTVILHVYRKPISSLAFSPDGKYLAVGDCGHNPTVRIWDITSSNEEHMVELNGHNYGISCVVSDYVCST